MARKRTAQQKFRAHWHGILHRCTNENNLNFKYYSARGIADSWLIYENFCSDMYADFLKHYAQYPKNTTLDRIDNALGYSKENCRWATWEIQYKNKSGYSRGKHPMQILIEKKWGRATDILAVVPTTVRIPTMSSKFYPLLVRFSKEHRVHLRKRARALKMTPTDLVRLLVDKDAITSSSAK